MGVSDFEDFDRGRAGVRGTARRVVDGARDGSHACMAMYWKVFERFRRFLMNLRVILVAARRQQHLDDLGQDGPNPPKSTAWAGDGGAPQGGAAGAPRWARGVRACAWECFERFCNVLEAF